MPYYQFKSPDGEPYGSFETFRNDEPVMESGWYWWACFPGCLPDSDPSGPFETELEAMMDALKENEEGL